MSNIKIQSFDGSVYSQLLPQNSASLTTYSNSQTGISATNVQDAIDSCFTSVSNGKSAIASAITDMGVSTGQNDSFQTMSDNIRKIESYEIRFGPFLNCLDMNYAGVIETKFSNKSGQIYCYGCLHTSDNEEYAIFKNQYKSGYKFLDFKTEKALKTSYMFENANRNVEFCYYMGMSSYTKDLYVCFIKVFD